jgi:hypothetical protein
MLKQSIGFKTSTSSLFIPILRNIRGKKYNQLKNKNKLIKIYQRNEVGLTKTKNKGQERLKLDQNLSLQAFQNKD